MRYQVSLAIPANTPKSNPVVEELALPFGELTECYVMFPWGCAGLAHVRILHNERQIYPTTTNEWFEGNDIEIVFDCRYELGEAWNRFKVEGYNEDDFYPHTPIIQFSVLPVSGLWVRPEIWVEG